jgi:hypothetical protein
MPTLVREYGPYRQFDIVGTVDQETFLKVKKNALVSGFSIDEKGRIVGTLNTVSYMKVSPPHIDKINRPKKVKSDEDDDEEEDDDTDSELKKEHFKNMTQTQDWLIARTIYATITVKGRIGIDTISDDESELIV